ncbi:tyrosine-protein phosphatase [Desulfovermiculus halophilus]|uniref:tyrosine-protein phosphatase n=1 Tax=Desulfovermiculus halophilus TaxID=339722 RepID=UPI000688DD85|nr:CpsB/CapC family capsule biosynthesis tyrosine phosphatase [Desulfovermiculus halophilus]
MIDIHCHILPGLDDGPETDDESLDMLRMAAEDGITDIICTPHHLPGLYPTRAESITAAVSSLQQKADAARIALVLHPGMEVHVSAAEPAGLDSGTLLGLNAKNNAVLLELPHNFVPPNLDTFFWSFISVGIRPVLAHVERNTGLLTDPSPLEKWVPMGVITQVTASSLLGRFGPDVEDFAWRLMECNLAHVLATDAHSPHARRPLMSDAAAEIEARLGLELARDMTQHRPRALLHGQDIDLPDPVPMPANQDSPGLFRRLLSWIGG